jgi:hypothetical protein
MKCYRVWFTDETALLVDAASEADALETAQRLAIEQGSEAAVARAECLDKGETDGN